jgi:2-iminobutanoate/2-iminopropanoate deaminase
MKEIIVTKKAPAAIGPFYSQGTVHNGTLYVSGQLAIDPASGEICPGDITAQTHFVMQNISAIVDAAGGKMEDVLKCTVLLTDMAHFSKMNEAYASHFHGEPPARICYQVSELPKKGAIVEIDAIVAV